MAGLKSIILAGIAFSALAGVGGLAYRVGFDSGFMQADPVRCKLSVDNNRLHIEVENYKGDTKIFEYGYARFKNKIYGELKQVSY